MTGVPPPVVDRLLRRALRDGTRGDSIRGDLVEEFRERCTRDGGWRARWWYLRQAFSIWVRAGRLAGDAPGRRRRHMTLESIVHDVKYTLRSYAKTPSFTLAVLATLALGIGASTAIFSMVNAILLRPLPLEHPDRLIYVSDASARTGGFMSAAWPNYLDWRARARSVEMLAASREEPQTLTGRERPRRVRARRITGNFFRVVGVRPALGRDFSDDDDRPGAACVTALSDPFWRTELGADPAVVGQVLQLSDLPCTIVAVMPRGFEYLRPYDIFISMGPVSGSANLVNRGNHNGFNSTGRLAAGVTVDAAARELREISAALEREHPATNTDVTAKTERLSDRFLVNVRLTLLALFGAVGFLLLIACVNVANLLVARGAARQHELAVRSALGGGRGRLVGQLLIESTVISAIGGALGVALAAWLLRVLVAAAPDGTPRLASVSLDVAALEFALAAAAICGLVFGAFPAFQAAGVRGQQALIRGRAAGFTAGSHRLRRGLMIVETALAIVLLAGAGLMIRTLQQLTAVETGFNPDRLLTTQLEMNGPRWTMEKQHEFTRELVSRVRALPGVASAALTFALPIDGSQWNSVFVVAENSAPPRSALRSAAFTPVSEGYFETIGMRLVRGRTFDVRDSGSAQKIVVVNEAFARQMWPGADPIGRRLKQGWPEDKTEWREVVGVVGDVKFNGLREETPIQVYLPLTKDETSRHLAIVARTPGDPSSLTSAIAAVVHDLDKDLPLFLTRTMDQMLDTSMAQQRLSMIVFIVFAVLAVTLAAIGLYGVVAHAVTERTHEIGVRMALGAGRRDVLALVVSQGLSMAVVGTVIGVAGALALSRVVQGLLFGVTATDPMTFAAVVGTLLTVALVACTVPAYRAVRVDPSAALRAE